MVFVGQFSLQAAPFHEILRRMNSETSSNSAAAVGTSVSAPRIDPRRLFVVLSNPLRLKLLKLMAVGRPLSATEAASIMHRDIDIVIQHMRILRDAGLLTWKHSDQDARFLFYSLKPEWRTQPNILDFGFCRIDLSAIPDYPTRARRR